MLRGTSSDSARHVEPDLAPRGIPRDRGESTTLTSASSLLTGAVPADRPTELVGRTILCPAGCPDAAARCPVRVPGAATQAAQDLDGLKGNDMSKLSGVVVERRRGWSFVVILDFWISWSHVQRCGVACSFCCGLRPWPRW